jgi:hypothetical protein
MIPLNPPSPFSCWSKHIARDLIADLIVQQLPGMLDDAVGQYDTAIRQSSPYLSPHGGSDLKVFRAYGGAVP